MERSRYRLVFFIFIFSALFAVQPGFNYQSKLFYNNAPVNGYKYFRYEIWLDANANGEWNDGIDRIVWTDEPGAQSDSTNVNYGLFSDVIYDDSDPSNSLLDTLYTYADDSLYFRVYVASTDTWPIASWTELGSELLLSSPYAIVAGGGGGTPGDGNGAVQFNSGDVFGGDANEFFWDNTNKRLGIGTQTPSERLDVAGNIELNSNQIKNLATPTSSGSAVGNGVSTGFLLGKMKAETPSHNFKFYAR